MQFLMHLTPARFAMPVAGWAATVLWLNPLTPLVLTARDWLTGMTPAYLGDFFWGEPGNLGVVVRDVDRVSRRHAHSDRAHERLDSNA